ncbi:hypothetical protein F511_41691 [Dorcoceras hygrometricum]|uniref:Mucin-2-like n=1 Tax=Dorcoceras hygrometricum TaxID=472368 RepID=A0A2Z7AY20_9LAMI|nr:hypothetical protein F511_41691 [Dorcoceras hygrometricum]
MASALINNASQIYFDSVFGMDNEGMVKMFKALESSGLKGFLGCSSVIYEAALVEFFHNASVQNDKVVSTVQGKSVEFTEAIFAGTFELPTEGLIDMSDVPKYLVFDARTTFSYDVTVKASSFDASTHERFLMMSAIHGGVKGAPDLDWGESKDFPPLKILTPNTVGTYVDKNKNITVDVDEPAGDEPVVKKKATSKRRPTPAIERIRLRTVYSTDMVTVKFNRNNTIRSTAKVAVNRDVHIRVTRDRDVIIRYRYKSMSIEDILKQIPKEMMLPSVTAVEITRIKFGLVIEIPGVNEGDYYKASLPRIATSDKVKDIVAKEEQMLASAETDSLETAVQRRIALVIRGTVRDLEVDPTEFCGVFRRGPDAQLISFDSSSFHPDPDSLSTSSTSTSPMDFVADIPRLQQSPADSTQILMPTTAIPATYFIESFAQLRTYIDNLEKSLVEAHTQQDQVLRGLIKNVRQEVQIQIAALLLEILESKREVRAQYVILTTYLADIRKEVQDQKAAMLAFREESQEHYS